MTPDRDLLTDTDGMSDDQLLVLLARGGLLSVERALREVDIAQPETLARFDELARVAAARHTGVVNFILVERVELSTTLAAMFLLGLIRNWKPGSADGMVIAASTIGELWVPDPEQRGSFEAQVVHASVEAATAVAALVSARTSPGGDAGRASDAMYRLALTMKAADRVEPAVSCAHAAANLSFGDLTRAEVALELAVALASQKGDPDALAIGVSRHAESLIQAARKHPERRGQAYDAVDRALLVLGRSEAARRRYLDRFEQLIATEPYLRPILPLAWTMLPPDRRPAFSHLSPGQYRAIAAVASPVFAGSGEDFVPTIAALMPWQIAVEDRRLALDETRAVELAQTDWNGWSIDHPSLRRAVPHSLSLLREKELDNILLVLHHEISHVYSMAGFIGVALIVIRLAVFDRETELWTLTKSNSKAFNAREAAGPEPTRLDSADPAALAVAEQQLELERKLQIVEDFWSPWFEGIAVFGEAAADPRLDADAASPPVEVLFNMWDRSVGDLAEESGLSVHAAATAEWSRAEGLLGEAIARSGRARLRAYLDNYHRHYLAGYIGVRSIVSRWRQTLRGALNGAQAFRVLLHVTRYSDLGAFPDLRLPHPEFREAISRHHREWLRTIAAISAEDLTRIRDYAEADDSKAYRWTDGRLLVSENSDELTRELEKKITELAGQATFSLRTDATRARDAGSACRAMMTAAWQFLVPKRRPELLAPERVSSVISRLMILALGRVSCPFWMNPETGQVACLVRTTESAADTGAPSYDVVEPVVTGVEFSELLAQTASIGERRMLVTRVADLQHRRTGRGPGLGQNLLVFQYGDWTHIERAGLFTGSDEEIDSSLRESIVSRLGRADLVVAQESLAGEGHPAARRTAAWIDSSDWSIEMDGDEADLAPWARHVRELADVVLARGQGADREEASRQLLQFVLSDDVSVARLRAQGLSRVRDVGPAAFTELVRILWETGYRPVADREGLASLSLGVSESVAPLLERSDIWWDVTRPAQSR